jgi:hypothetical protein
MQGRYQEDTTEQESRTCRSKIVMLHYDESMKSVQTGITRRVGARIEAKRKGEQKNL